MKTLYEISAAYQQAMDKILAADTITEEQLNEIESIDSSFESKILNYTSMIKEFEAKSEAIKKAINKMKDRADSLDNAADYLRNRAQNEMEKCNKKLIENEYHRVLLRKNGPSLDIINEDLIPVQYFRRKETVDPNRTELLNLLKEGCQIPGVKLKQTTSLIIR